MYAPQQMSFNTDNTLKPQTNGLQWESFAWSGQEVPIHGRCIRRRLERRLVRAEYRGDQNEIGPRGLRKHRNVKLRTCLQRAFISPESRCAFHRATSARTDYRRGRPGRPPCGEGRLALRTAARSMRCALCAHEFRRGNDLLGHAIRTTPSL